MIDVLGIPPLVDKFRGIDYLGARCRIATSVSVLRGISEKCIILGDDVTLFDGIRLVVGDRISCPNANIILGNQVVVNVGGYLSGEGSLTLEDEVLVGPYASLLSAGHQIHGGALEIARNPLTYAPICIKRGVWIGAHATILEGVTIGKGAVIGAGAVVTQDIPAFAVALGVPARVHHYRSGHKPIRSWYKFWRSR